MQSTGLMLFWLVAVLAMIPASLWLLKRSGLAAGAGRTDPGVLRSVSHLALGPGQRVVTVEVQAGEQRTWLVLGVTQQQITTLHTLAAPEGVVLPAPAATALPATLAQAPFAQLLRRVTDRTPSKDRSNA